MAFLSLNNIYVSYGEHPLLDNINLHIEQNQRICLLGRNGAGKSTIMKIMAGVQESDSGQILTDNEINVRYFEQDIPEIPGGLVFDIICGGFPENAAALQAYYREEEKLENNGGGAAENVHTPENWEMLQRVKRIAQDLGIDSKAEYSRLSGGQKRRALLGAALVSRPDLLLLDEPTNHLDIDTITWLEEYILKFCPTVLFVTHDRAFLRRLATRIIELDRGNIFDYQCSYDVFLGRKAAFLEAQEKEWANFDKKLSEEEAWLRKGIKARRTRNEGRVKALLKMRDERKQRRTIQSQAKLAISEDGKSGKIVVEAAEISFSWDSSPLIRGFSALIARGDKTGIIGANGAGKTTLVNLLLGKIAPSSGSVKTGSNLSVAFFDQMRDGINPEKSVQENVQPNGDTVTINGKPRHIISYLADFLFSTDRARSPVAHLSGGERNRLLLAKLFTQPCNFLVMDEPTNDLDSETLELLEDLIVEFEGTALIISHDRAFLNNTTTSLLVFEDGGTISEITGGYDDWLVYRRKRSDQAEGKKGSPEGSGKNAFKKERTKTKLSFKEQKELDEFPARIEELEKAVEELYAKMAEPEVYQDAEKIRKSRDQQEKLESALQEAYARWEELESERERLGSE